MYIILFVYILRSCLEQIADTQRNSILLRADWIGQTAGGGITGHEYLDSSQYISRCYGVIYAGSNAGGVWQDGLEYSGRMAPSRQVLHLLDKRSCRN